MTPTKLHSKQSEGDRRCQSQTFSIPLKTTTSQDLLLTGSALGVSSRLIPDTSWGRFGLNLARHPGLLAQRVGSFGRELVSIATGTCDRAPPRTTNDSAIPAWAGNPLLKRSMQTYLASTEIVDTLFSDAELDGRDAERIRFVLDVVMEGLAPSNNPLISPLAWKAVVDTGGLSVVRGCDASWPIWPRRRGFRRWWSSDAFTVGEDLAVTPGAVVPQRGVRTHPVHTSNREGVDGAPADGAAGDQ